MKRYTGAEARELAARATHTSFAVTAETREYAATIRDVRGAVVARCKLVCDANLLAAAPDLAASLAAVEAERDALWAAAQAVLSAYATLGSFEGRTGAPLEAALAALREAAK